MLNQKLTSSIFGLVAVSLIFFSLFLSPKSVSAVGESWNLLSHDGNINSFQPRHQHSAVWDDSDNRILLFGGTTFFPFTRDPLQLNDLWQFTENLGWQQLIPSGSSGSPSARDRSSMVWDSQNNRVLLFGGITNIGNISHNDLWQYTAAGGWQLLTSDNAGGSPSARYAHSAVWDSNNNRLLVYGGFIQGNPSNDVIWQYTDTSGWQLLASYPNDSSNIPGPRVNMVAVWDAQQARMIIFGGNSRFGNFEAHNDLWQFTESNGWLKLTDNGAAGSPPVRSVSAGAWDNNNNRLLIHGGVLGAIDYNDLWEYSSVGWQVITPQNISVPPPTRTVHQSVWDNQNSRFYTFGGFAYNGQNLNDLWIYGIEPTNLPPTVNSNGGYQVLEGGSVQLSASGSDPDNDTLSYAWDLDNNGIFEALGQTFNYSVPSSLDGPIQRTIYAMSDDGHLDATQRTNLFISNSAPTATFSNTSGDVLPGQAATIAFNNQNDPSSADFAAGFKYSFDCTDDGSFEVTDSTTASYGCTYSSGGSFTAKGRIKDKDNGFRDYTTTVNVLGADISISIIDSPDPLTPQNELTYTIIVTNNGPQDATNVILSDTLPTGPNFISVTSTQGTCSGITNITCLLGVINNNDNATITIKVKPTSTGVLFNTSSVSADQSDPNSSNNSILEGTTVATPQQISSLRVAIQGQGGVVSNIGGISCHPTCTADFLPGANVTLTATPDSGWEFLEWEAGCTGSSLVCNLTVNSDTQVRARFRH